MPSLNKSNLLTTSLKIPSMLNQKMNEKIIQDGYGMRGKSKWIKEAISAFLELPSYIKLVGLSDEVEKGAVTVSFRAPKQLMLEIEEAISNIRLEYPLLEGVKSKIIRVSIYQRILRNYKNSGDRKNA